MNEVRNLLRVEDEDVTNLVFILEVAAEVRDDLDAIMAQWAPEIFEFGSGVRGSRSLFAAISAWLRGLARMLVWFSVIA